MKPALRPVVCALAVTLCVLPASAGTRVEDPDIRWEAYVGERLDGSTLEGRIGRIRVPSNRARGGDATQEIAFVHYASDNPEPGPPIVFLVGGPGPSGIEWCAQTAADPRLRLLDFADVIGIDQRGTGLSRPDLSAGPEFSYELPLDRAITRDEVVAAWQDMAARSLESWRAQGLDPADYNTAESADDVDAVRAALGFEQIVPWGTSYGSHLGLAYLRRHPEHAARAVLMKVEAPDATFKLPATSQRRLEHVAELVRRDEQLAERLPDLVGSVREILAGLREQPVTLTTSRGGQTLSVVLGAYDVQCALSQALADSQNVAGLPFAVHLMTQGFYEHMLGFALRNRFGELGSPMAYLMDCASGTTAARRARIERELADEGNLLGDGLSAPFHHEACAAAGEVDLGDGFRAPFACDVPTLFVSGELDARTPPENVEVLQAGFSQQAHVLVTNTGHDDRELESPEYRELLAAFLRGEPVASVTLELPPLGFRPLMDL